MNRRLFKASGEEYFYWRNSLMNACSGWEETTSTINGEKESIKGFEKDDMDSLSCVPCPQRPHTQPWSSDSGPKHWVIAQDKTTLVPGR